jgi:hypothetical protein
MSEKIAIPMGFSLTPQCIHHWGVNYYYEQLHEYSEKIEIVSRHACWDQETLFDEKNRRQKIS